VDKLSMGKRKTMLRQSIALMGLVAVGCHFAPAKPPAPAAPIAWHRFTPAAFEEARREGKLVMVDAGIEGCTACRWMHEGTYTDPDVERRVGQSFVAVSVDADQEPDLGDRFEPWGWPATVFFAPDGRQVYALEGSEGPKPFAKLLDELVAKSRAHNLDVGPLTAQGDRRDLERENLVATCSDVNARLEAIADGNGWGGRERVALVGPFEHALIRARSRGASTLEARSHAVAEGEAKLLDPVWGGVFVAAISETWDRFIPEKRTFQEAAALDSFALELHRTGDARWKPRVDLVRKYLEEWMRAPDGTFYSTQRDEAPRLPAGMSATEYYALGDAERRAHGVPAIDHGIYTDQNAAVIEAYVRVYEATGDKSALDVATRAANELLARRTRSDGGMGQTDLTPELEGDARLRPKVLDDRLFLKAEGEMGLALLYLVEATRDPRYLEAAQGIARALAALEDPGQGGFFATTPRDTDTLVARKKPLTDNLTAARFLVRLAAATREKSYAERAERALVSTLHGADLRRSGPWDTGLAALVLEEHLLGPVEITVVRGSDPGTAEELYDAAIRIYEPRKIVRIEEPGHYPRPTGGAAAYVCTRTSCSSSMKDIADVRAAVERLTLVGPDAVCAR